MNPNHSLRLAQTLQQMFMVQARDVMSRIDLDSDRPPDMTGWVDATARASQPLLLQQWQQGMVLAAARIASKLGQRPPVNSRTGLRTYRPGNDAIFGVRNERTQVSSDLVKRWSSGLPNTATVKKSYRRVVAKAADVTLDFDLFNPRVLDAVNQAAFAFCRETMDTATSDLKTAMDDLRKMMRGGLSRGDAVQLLAKKVREVFADPARAFRIATTECLTGDCVIRGANLKGVYRRHYRGALIEATIESGEKITGTRNHPVLTKRGWRTLGSLVEGDYLVHNTNNINWLNGSTRSEQDQQPPVTLNEVFNSLSATSVVERIPMTAQDFHGDGSEGYVYVLTTRRLLRYGSVPSPSDLLNNLNFICTDPLSPIDLDGNSNLLGPGFVVNECINRSHISLRLARFAEYLLDLTLVKSVLWKPLANLLLRYASFIHVDDFEYDIVGDRYVVVPTLTTTSDPVIFGNCSYTHARCSYSSRNDGRVTTEQLSERLNVCTSFVHLNSSHLLLSSERWSKRRAREVHLCGLLSATHANAHFLASPSYHRTAATNYLASSREAESARVEFSRLKNLRVIEGWHGYVYNLETVDGYYDANGIITKNSSRAMHGGQYMAAKESGVCRGMTWLASADACKMCLKLDGRTVKFGVPFITLPGGGVYNTIYHPPAHPHCHCDETEDLA